MIILAELTAALAAVVGLMVLLRVVMIVSRRSTSGWVNSEVLASTIAILFAMAISGTMAFLTIELFKIGLNVWSAFPLAVLVHFGTYLLCWWIMPHSGKTPSGLSGPAIATGA